MPGREAPVRRDRAKRGPLARIRSEGDLLATRSPADQLKPGCAARSPGFLFCMPRWRNWPYAHASEACLSGFESRVGYQIYCASECACACSFTTWMWQRRPRRACWPMPIGCAAGWRGFPSIPAGNASLLLAVAQRPARVVRDDEDAGSTPAGETNRFPSSSADQRARGYDPRGRGFESLPGCQSWRRNSEERVPACRAGGRGFKSRRRRQYSGA